MPVAIRLNVFLYQDHLRSVAVSTGSTGLGDFSYAWSPSTNLSAANVANPTYTSTAPVVQKYFVTVTDNVSAGM
jgi:hypothetical protein